MKGLPTQAEVQDALAVLSRLFSVETYGLEDFPFWEPECWERLGVGGMTRRGKSALMKAFCRFLMKKGRRLIVADIDDEYSPEGVEREDCWLGPLRQRVTVRELLALVQAGDDILHREDLALAIVPEDPTEDPEAVAAQLVAIAPHLRDAPPLVMLFEELGYWGEYAAPMLHAAAARWGKRGHVPVFIGQCLTDCPEKARKQWSTVITAQQVKESDLIFLQRQAGRRARMTVGRLPRRRFVRLNLDVPRPEDLEEEVSL